MDKIIAGLKDAIDGNTTRVTIGDQVWIRSDDKRAEQIVAQLARIEIALNSALNMIDGDGRPPDWDYLRLVRSQLPSLQEAIFPTGRASA